MSSPAPRFHHLAAGIRKLRLVVAPGRRNIGTGCAFSAGRELHMRASTAYFAGAGTVIAAIVGGIGGGLLFADIVSPKGPKQEMTRLEQRMSAQPIQVKADPSEPAPNPAAPPSSTTAAAPAAPAPMPPQAQSEATKTVPAAAPPADAVAAKQPAAPAVQSEVPPSQPSASKSAEIPSHRRKRRNRPPLRPRMHWPRPRTSTSSEPLQISDAASDVSNGPRSGARSSGRNRSCAKLRKRYGKKPKPGR